MNALEFSRSHDTTTDWIGAMGARDVVLLKSGQKGTYCGFPATVVKHYINSMYEVRVPGGLTCISGADFVREEQC